MAQMFLPKKADELVEALDVAERAAWGRRNYFYLLCQIAFYYVQGLRRFKVSSYEDAKIMVGYESDLGEMRFRNEDLRNKYRTEVGRYLRMNIDPAVEKVSWGIDALRNASIGKVTLDHELRFVDKNQLKSRLIQMFLLYGTVGVQHYRSKAGNGETHESIEVVPPWELLPLPAHPTSPEERCGLMRAREVPKEWLETKASLSSTGLIKLPRGTAGRTKMQAREVTAGTTPRNEDGDSVMDGGAFRDWATRNSNTSEGRGTKIYLPLRETWLQGPDNTCARYVIKVGDVILEDYDFFEEGVVVPMPIEVARHTPDCGFYSPGFVMGLMAMNHQIEGAVATLFKNVQDLDTYGMLFWPQSLGVGKKEFAKRDGRPGIVTYDPDLTAGPEMKPFVVPPYNSGDSPGKLVALGNQMQDKNANQGPQFSGGAPGRVDSAAGLGFLFEVQNIGLAAASHELANAISQVYKSILHNAKHRFSSKEALALTYIDDNVAGIVLDAEGKMSLADNPIPDFWEVKLDIQDRMPKSKEQQKQELVGMLQMGVITPPEFRIENQRLDLGFQTGNRGEWEQYRKAVFNNILMFGDGKTSGGSVYSLVHDNPEIHLKALVDFTSRLEFALASKEVREVFDKHKQMIQEQLAGFPSGMPTPDMMAAPPGQPGQPPPGGPMMPPGGGSPEDMMGEGGPPPEMLASILGG